MRRLVILAVIVVAVVAGAWLLLGGGAGPGGGIGSTPAPSIPPVPPSTEIVADGRAVPIRVAELTVAVPGTIAGVLVAEGDRVNAGDALVQLDTAAADAEVAAAEAAVTAAEASAAAAAAGVAQASAAVDAATAAVDQAQAGIDGARAARDAVPSGASGAQKRAANAEIDGARAARAAARANLRAAGASATAAEETSRAAAADVQRAKAGLAVAQEARARLTVVAPFTGTVASLDARVGEQASPGIPLVRVADTSSWQIETTDLDETTVARIAVGARVTITFDGLPDVTVEGTVAAVALYGSLAQGDIVYRAVVEPANVPDGLRWNMTATVTVAVGK